MNAPTHELARLLLELGCAGVQLAPHAIDAARLRFSPAALPPDLLARLRTDKAAILGLLMNGYAPAGGDAGYVLGERLGMADDLKQPTHPGSAAWMVAVGESIGHSCELATDRLHLGNGKTNGCNSGGGESERPNSLFNRQGCESGP